MKKTLAIAIVLASITTYAQTETTTTAPSATAPTEATAPVAKSKVKKVKKTKKPSAMSPSKATAPVAGSLVEKETGTASIAPVNADSKGMAPAAGTSTVSGAELAPTKKWGALLKVYSTDDMNDIKNIQTLSTAGLSYKVSEKVTLKVAETFETLTVGDGVSDSQEKRDMVNSSNFRPSYTDITASVKTAGILGSNDMTSSLNYKMMGGDSVYTTIGGYAKAKSFVEANLSMPYSLSPKVDVSVDSQWRHVINRDAANSNRFLVVPSISYAFSDVFSVYQAGGVILSMRDNTDFRRNYTRAYIETGVSITPMKNFSIGLDICQDKALQSSNDGVDVTNWTPYSSNISNNGATEADRQGATLDAVAYEGTISYTF